MSVRRAGKVAGSQIGGVLGKALVIEKWSLFGQSFGGFERIRDVCHDLAQYNFQAAPYDREV